VVKRVETKSKGASIQTTLAQRCVLQVDMGKPSGIRGCRDADVADGASRDVLLFAVYVWYRGVSIFFLLFPVVVVVTETVRVSSTGTTHAYHGSGVRRAHRKSARLWTSAGRLAVSVRRAHSLGLAR
jgi:hypothetical protein